MRLRNSAALLFVIIVFELSAFGLLAFRNETFDPLALDQACVDACLKQQPLPNSQLWDNLRKPGFADWGDPFTNSTPNSEWRSCLEHAEKIGLGVREYEVIKPKL